MNQLWRFERAAGYPKGVHAITSVATGEIMRMVEGVLEDGSISYDFVFELDENDSQMGGMLGPDYLFIVFMDKDSESCDILLKPYSSDPYDDMFLCVDLKSGAIDICRKTDFPPSRFVLNIPAAQVKKSKFEITQINK